MTKPIFNRFKISLVIVLVFSSSLLWAQFGHRKRPKPSKLIMGVVVDENDHPISTAIVNLTNLQTKKISQDITDDKGQFQFGGVDPDIDYDVQAFYHNTQGPKERISIYDTRSKREFYWKLPISMADVSLEVNISFLITDAQGRGIPAAMLKFTGHKKIQTLTATTDSSGRTQTWLSTADTYSIVTAAKGYETDVRESFKPSSEISGLQIPLKPAK